MSKERLQILEMLAAGKVSAEEADRLIGALGERPAPAAAPAAGVTLAAKPRYLRVLVDDRQDGSNGPTKVNVRVPLQLLRAGVRLASLIPEVARDPINQALAKQGITVDVGQIKAADLEELVETLGELSVDVDQNEGAVKVRVFAE